MTIPAIGTVSRKHEHQYRNRDTFNLLSTGNTPIIPFIPVRNRYLRRDRLKTLSKCATQHRSNHVPGVILTSILTKPDLRRSTQDRHIDHLDVMTGNVRSDPPGARTQNLRIKRIRTG
jgi:hypothetical protein